MLVCSVQIISRLDSQSKFQMFTLFSGRHAGGTPTWRLIYAKYIVQYLKFRKRTDLKLGECLLYQSNIISQFINFFH